MRAPAQTLKTGTFESVNGLKKAWLNERLA